jgi:hypothetical protein
MNQLNQDRDVGILYKFEAVYIGYMVFARKLINSVPDPSNSPIRGEWQRVVREPFPLIGD